MGYPGLFNSSYQPSPAEVFEINHPQEQLGPVVTGEIFVTLLQGVLLVQYYEYICHFWHEKRWTKWLVHFTFFLCILKFGYVWFFVWDRLVTHYGDWAYLLILSPIAVPVGISSTLPSAACQVFYIHRCWKLSRNWFFLIPAVGSLLVTVGSGIALTWASALEAGGDASITNMILISINISLASGLICDIFITTFTCFYLIREKTGFTETDGLVSRLVKCSIESAAGPTVVNLINLILSNKTTNNQWFLLPNLSLSHVYGCSLLYTVNARKCVGNTMVKPKTLGTSSQMNTGIAHTKPVTVNNPNPLPDRMLASGRPEVFVEIETVMHRDNYHQQLEGKKRPQEYNPYEEPYAV